jgi:hypothetical protein
MMAINGNTGAEQAGKRQQLQNFNYEKERFCQNE